MYEGTVLVLGATGQTGQRVVKALVDKGIKVRALVRNAQKAEQLHALGIEVRMGNLTNDADVGAALVGIKAVISALGGTAEARPEDRTFIEHKVFEKLEQLGAEHKIDQIVMCSSIGTENPDSIPFLAPVLRLKRQGEQVIENGRIPYTIVRPGGLVNDPGGQDVGVARSHTIGGRISRDDVAEVLVQALLQPEARNKIVEIIQKDGAGKANRAHLFG
jgi:uncharacterized protein YbjT (DUF2867 family)